MNVRERVIAKAIWPQHMRSEQLQQQARLDEQRKEALKRMTRKPLVKHGA